jgi:quinol monooxygenase YgiN
LTVLDERPFLLLKFIKFNSPGWPFVTCHHPNRNNMERVYRTIVETGKIRQKLKLQSIASEKDWAMAMAELYNPTIMARCSFMKRSSEMKLKDTMEKFVIAKLFIQPARVDEFLRKLEVLAVLTKKEPGCLGYTYYPEPAQAGTFTVVEHYRDQASIRYHFEQPYLKEFIQKIEGWKSKDLKVYFLTVDPDAKDGR